MSTVPDNGICPDTGKKRHLRRADAKRVIRLKHQGEHLSAYRCGNHWHVGHLAAPVVHGHYSRDEVYGR